MPPAKEPTSVYKEYFDATAKYTEQYGPDTLVLMQVGAFFEVYGLKDQHMVPSVKSRIADFCKIGELKLADKSKDRYEGSAIQMAGFGEYNLEKYIRLLTEAQFTVVVFVQEDDMTRANAKKRVFHSVYSSGTFIPMEESSSSTSSTSNTIMNIWVRTFHSLKDGPKYLCSFSCVNLLSGHSHLYEYSTSRLLSPTSFDELERALSSFSPSEILFIKDDPYDEEAERILQYSGMNRSGTVLHRFAESHEKIVRLNKSAYVDTTLDFFFGEAAIQACAEFRMYEFATQNLCFLMDFVRSHNPNLVRKIDFPVFSNSSLRMVLANHTLKQLNILPVEGHGSKASSVSTFLDRTCCKMGSRLFQYQIQNPVFDETWLQNEYDMTDWFIREVPENIRSQIRRSLDKIRDMERISRQILMGKVYPSAMFQLHQSIEQYTYCLEWLEPYVLKAPPNHPLFRNGWMTGQEKNREFLTFMESHLQLSLCEEVRTMNGSVPFFQTGVCSEWDKVWTDWENGKQRLQTICDELNAVMVKYGSGKSSSVEVDFVKIHETQKSGCSLQLTSTRGNVLKDILKKHPQQTLKIDNKEISFSDISVSRNTRGDKTDMIEFPLLNQTCRDMIKWEEKSSSYLQTMYTTFLKKVETQWIDFLYERSKQLALLDVALAKATVAMENHYCRPLLTDTLDSNTSFFEAKDLRHVLIEHLQKKEIYVPNDLSIGTPEQRGLLLYGTNAVGKTSMIKSAGIAVIMAQSGLFVPCSQFTFRPYRAIYSRILGNDDMFRGLSTFVVEMSELRVILKMADSASLVLGDELCSGTETESALSIFTSGLMHLHERRASFMFATHLHEIVNYEEIRSLGDSVQMKHLSVYYDREKGDLIYDRKLKDGSGSALYGLEVAKSLSMPTEFIERAFQIRERYFPNSLHSSPLSFKPSRYNADKIRSFCENCHRQIGEEVHHIHPQKMADEKGFIGHFHKNHKANLMNLCIQCHDAIHSNEV